MLSFARLAIAPMMFATGCNLHSGNVPEIPLPQGRD